MPENIWIFGIHTIFMFLFFSEVQNGMSFLAQCATYIADIKNE